MDLMLYFDPVNFDSLKGEQHLHRESLGATLEKQSANIQFSGRKKPSLALWGIGPRKGARKRGYIHAPDQVRKALYQLSNFSAALRMVDLGNLKSGKAGKDILFAARDVTDYLREQGIVSIFLGGDQDLSVGIARAFRGLREFTFTAVDCRIDLKSGREATNDTNFISKLLQENPQLFHLQTIGIQAHFSPPSNYAFLSEKTFDHMPLRAYRDNPANAEPLLRNSHFVSFDMSAIRFGDAPGTRAQSPTGLSAEEACLIGRYSGLSSRLSVFGLFGLITENDVSGVTAKLAAQIVWYFMEGHSFRKADDPASDRTHFSTFFVETEKESENLTFYHQAVTNRWWIELQPAEGISWILGCSQEDYATAARGEIPEIYWKYFRKTELYLKY